MPTDGSNLYRGDWVFHSRMPDWGYGKIFESQEKKISVFFQHVGEKKLSLAHVDLEKVDTERISELLLDGKLDDFKTNLADSLLKGDQGQVMISACSSLEATCSLCNSKSNKAMVYGYIKTGRLPICSLCKDSINQRPKEKEDALLGTGTRKTPKTKKIVNRNGTVKKT